jgi:ABC-2 type transport system ATP-binding protein
VNVIEVSDLIVEYKRWRHKPVRAVDNLSFEVRQGEVVGFLGVNGAGKTSTIKALMGFQPATSGDIRIFGLPVGHVEARRQIGFLPETALYSPYLTPFETLRLYGELHGLSGRLLRIRIEALLESVGMIEKINTLNRNLSKGMLQRVGIAQALLSDPRLLILDEVSSGLDPVGRRELREILRAQLERGVSIFFSSHELGEVATLCNRILIMHRGQLIVEQTVQTLQSRVVSLEEYFVQVVQLERDPLLEVKAA